VATFAFQGLGEVTLRNLAAVDTTRSVFAAGILLLVGLLASGAWTSLTGEARATPGLLLAFIPFVIVQAGLTAGMISFQLERRNIGIAAWPVGFQAARLAGVGLVVVAGADVIAVPLGWCLLLAPLAWFGLRRMRSATKRIDRVPVTSTSGIVRAALPLSATRLLEFAEIQLPVVLAMPLLGAAETGRIAACLAIVQGLLLLPISIFQRLLRARFHAWSREDPKRLCRQGLFGAAAMSLAGTVIGMALMPFTPDILGIVFGEEFTTAAGFLRSMLFLLPIWFASIAVNATLVSPRWADLRFGSQVLGLGILIATVLFLDAGEASANIIVTGMFASQIFLLVSGALPCVIRQFPPFAPEDPRGTD
jgi:O-antigen/teichoic acid export membrane protein